MTPHPIALLSKRYSLKYGPSRPPLSKATLHSTLVEIGSAFHGNAPLVLQLLCEPHAILWEASSLLHELPSASSHARLIHAATRHDLTRRTAVGVCVGSSFDGCLADSHGEAGPWKAQPGPRRGRSAHARDSASPKEGGQGQGEEAPEIATGLAEISPPLQI
jgi:hypothetical protein